jgi:hypothetical protein
MIIVGYLPFEDENIQHLMHNIVFTDVQITAARQPPREVPDARIEIAKIKMHPWFSMAESEAMLEMCEAELQRQTCNLRGDHDPIRRSPTSTAGQRGELEDYPLQVAHRQDEGPYATTDPPQFDDGRKENGNAQLGHEHSRTDVGGSNILSRVPMMLSRSGNRSSPDVTWNQGVSVMLQQG